MEDVAGTVADLIKEGKVLYWGLSEASEEDIRRAHAVCPLTAIQDRYSMMARWHEALFPTLEELGIGLVAFSPLANGLLSDCYTAASRFDAQTDYRAAMPQFQPDSYDKNHGLLQLIRRLAGEKHATPAQISLGVLSVLASPPFRGRAVLRDCRTQSSNGTEPTSNIRTRRAQTIDFPSTI